MAAGKQTRPPVKPPPAGPVTIAPFSEITRIVEDKKEYSFSFVAGAVSNTLTIGFRQAKDIQVKPEPDYPATLSEEHLLTLNGCEPGKTYNVVVRGTAL